MKLHTSDNPIVNYLFRILESNEDYNRLDVVPTLTPPDEGRFGQANGCLIGYFILPPTFDGSEPIFKNDRMGFTYEDCRKAVAVDMLEDSEKANRIMSAERLAKLRHDLLQAASSLPPQNPLRQTLREAADAIHVAAI